MKLFNIFTVTTHRPCQNWSIKWSCRFNISFSLHIRVKTANVEIKSQTEKWNSNTTFTKLVINVHATIGTQFKFKCKVKFSFYLHFYFSFHFQFHFQRQPVCKAYANHWEGRNQVTSSVFRGRGQKHGFWWMGQRELLMYI